MVEILLPFMRFWGILIKDNRFEIFIKINELLSMIFKISFHHIQNNI